METNDFLVKSMSHCFLCLDPVSPVKKHQGSDFQSYSICSLYNLSRYLKMDLAKVFNDNELIPQHLLDKVRKSKLKGELCDECALMNDNFSEQYLKLEKIKMEMLSSLRLIQDKMKTAMETNKSEELRKLADSVASDPVDGWTGKLDILEVLRSEAIQKCTQKICSDAPRPKVQKLTMHQVTHKRQMFKLNSIRQSGGLNTNFQEAPDQELGCRNVKTDFLDRMDGDDGDSIHSFDNLDMHCSDGSDNPVVTDGDQDISYLKVEDRSSGPPVGVQSKFKATSKKKIKSHSSVQSASVPASASGSNNNVEMPEARLNPETGKYKCSQCPREFTQKCNLKTHHKSVHLGVKYKCTICGIEFTYRSAFNLHHKTIHMGVRLQCRGCNKMFKQKHHLIAHQRKHGCKPLLTKTEMT